MTTASSFFLFFFPPPLRDKERTEEERSWRRKGESRTGGGGGPGGERTRNKTERERGEGKEKVIKARGEGERLETPLNKSQLPSKLSVSRLFLLVTEDQLVLLTGVSPCAIGWISGQCGARVGRPRADAGVQKDPINKAWIGATGGDRESCRR